jgi:hypothetical protein
MQKGTPQIFNVSELKGSVLTGVGRFKLQDYIPSYIFHDVERNIFSWQNII